MRERLIGWLIGVPGDIAAFLLGGFLGIAIIKLMI